MAIKNRTRPLCFSQNKLTCDTSVPFPQLGNRRSTGVVITVDL